MRLDELVRLKALEIKRLHSGHGDMQDHIIDDLLKQNGSEFRNICAHISPALYAEIDELCGNLSISKRRFVEGALIDAVKRGNAIMAEVQPFDLEG